jgi:hypothetical protein
MKKKYQLGVMDLYPFAINKTCIENSPFLKVQFVEKVDAKRLHIAVKCALKDHPFFACTVVYDKQYYLIEHDKEFKLFNVSEEKRPLEYGDNTNGFLWQICYDDYHIIFEWCHGISDGKGAYEFIASILSYYFNTKRPVELNFYLGLENLYDKNEKGTTQKKQPNGFKANNMPYIKRGYKTDCHILKASMKEVLSVSKKNDSSPAAVLPPLFSMAIRKNLSKEIKNRNVCCSVVIDCRGPMKFKTMHNCIVSKKISYIDKYDKLDFSKVSTIYRSLIDLAVQPENIVWEVTNMVNTLKPLVFIKPRWFQKLLAKIVTKSTKHTDSNFTFTYLGKVDLAEEVMKGICDFSFRSWHDFGECNLAAVDFDGTLVLNICENYCNKNVVKDFIDICNKAGIHFEIESEYEYEQANLRIEKL